MKKLLNILLALTLTMAFVGCTAKADLNPSQNKEIKENQMTCTAAYSYEGKVIEIINGDNPDTEFIEGTLLLQLKNSDEKSGNELIAVYITKNISKESLSMYKVNDMVQFATDYELNFTNAKDLPHVSPLTIEKIQEKN